MQQVNFYRHLDKQEEQPFSALQNLWLTGAAAVVMLVVYLGLLLAGGVDKELKAVTMQKNDLDTRVLALDEQKLKALQNPQLDARLAWLEAEVAFRRQLLATVDPDQQLADSGFAEHLQGLGRQVIDGLWFTAIELSGSGSEMVLTGSTLQPEYVPRYLQKLSSEAIFNGHQFQVLRMSTPESKRGGMDFEVRSRPVGSKS